MFNCNSVHDFRLLLIKWSSFLLHENDYCCCCCCWQCLYGPPLHRQRIYPATDQKNRCDWLASYRCCFCMGVDALSVEQMKQELARWVWIPRLDDCRNIAYSHRGRSFFNSLNSRNSVGTCVKTLFFIRRDATKVFSFAKARLHIYKIIKYTFD